MSELPADIPAVLKVSTVARLLDCSPWTVRRRIHDGELAAVMHNGRMAVLADDLRAYVDALERVGVRPGRPSPRHARRTYDYLR